MGQARHVHRLAAEGVVGRGSDRGERLLLLVPAADRRRQLELLDRAADAAGQRQGLHRRGREPRRRVGERQGEPARAREAPVARRPRPRRDRDRVVLVRQPRDRVGRAEDGGDRDRGLLPAGGVARREGRLVHEHAAAAAVALQGGRAEAGLPLGALVLLPPRPHAPREAEGLGRPEEPAAPRPHVALPDVGRDRGAERRGRARRRSAARTRRASSSPRTSCSRRTARPRAAAGSTAASSPTARTRLRGGSRTGSRATPRSSGRGRGRRTGACSTTARPPIRTASRGRSARGSCGGTRSRRSGRAPTRPTSTRRSRRTTCRPTARPAPTRSGATTRSSCRPTGRAGSTCRRASRTGRCRRTTSRTSRRSTTRSTRSARTRGGSRTRTSREDPYNPVGSEPGSDVYPYVLTTYRLTEHHCAGGFTRFTPYLSELQPAMFVEVHPELARERGLAHGDWATIVTARSAIEARVMVTDRMRPVRIERPRPAPGRAAVPLGIARADDRRLRERPHAHGARPERAHPGGQGAHVRHPARAAAARREAAAVRRGGARAREGTRRETAGGKPRSASSPTRRSASAARRARSRARSGTSSPRTDSSGPARATTTRRRSARTRGATSRSSSSESRCAPTARSPRSTPSRCAG